MRGRTLISGLRKNSVRPTAPDSHARIRLQAPNTSPTKPPTHQPSTSAAISTGTCTVVTASRGGGSWIIPMGVNTRSAVMALSMAATVI